MKKSSLVDSNVKFPRNDQLSIPSWLIIAILIVTLVVLKKFMYIKDGKRDGK